MPKTHASALALLMAAVEAISASGAPSATEASDEALQAQDEALQRIIEQQQEQLDALSETTAEE